MVICSCLCPKTNGERHDSKTLQLEDMTASEKKRDPISKLSDEEVKLFTRQMTESLSEENGVVRIRTIMTTIVKQNSERNSLVDIRENFDKSFINETEEGKGGSEKIQLFIKWVTQQSFEIQNELRVAMSKWYS